jgi:ribonucleoside-diphosphate reductase alpha chain
MAKKINIQLKDTDFKTLTEKKSVDMSDNARNIFLKRYSLKDQNGSPKESIEEAFKRVSNHVAGGEEQKSDKEKYAKAFFNLMADKRFVPNTPTWTGADTPLGQLAACFVLPIKDDMGKDPEGIFSTLRDAALVQQTGGGNGFSFSNLRPKGARVSTSNGVASGPIGFLEAYDASFGVIAQGGTRRGANMAVLSVDHPDIMDFIKCKSVEGTISNFNISVAVTDKFMKAVADDTDFELINPKDKSLWSKIRAREIFDEIVKYAYKNGEPGVLFIDAANRYNPVPNQYVLEATNPCGEQWLGPYENCCLGHVNINASIKNGEIDWEHLRESIILGVRFLDNVVTQNKYVPSVPKLKESALKNRRIGLGFMGLADAMYNTGIRYGSKESLDFASQLTEFIKYHAMLTSISLAKEKGPFPGIKGSIYDSNNFKWEAPESLVKYRLNLKRPDINWKTVEKDMKKYGIRNATQLTVAPTGTTATVYDLEGYGCEPVFALAYYRNVYQSAGGEKNLQLTYVSPSFQRILDESNIDEDIKKKIIEEALNKGTIQHMADIPEEIKHTFVVSADIVPEEHVKMQAAIQKFVDNSISKTCNFPEGASIDDVKKVYLLAWELGCKGLTVYVTGSRQEVVLETKETKDKKDTSQTISLDMITESKVLEVSAKRPRPSVVSGRTHEVLTPFGKAFVTVNRNGETGKNPFEVFVTIGKSGTDLAALAEGTGRLISGWLRSANDPNKALEEIAYQLKGIGGSTSIGFGTERVSSIPDAIAKVLISELKLSDKLDHTNFNLLPASEYEQENLFEQIEESRFDENADLNIENTDKKGILKNASVCPECKNLSLIEIEGCIKCQNCGYSRC